MSNDEGDGREPHGAGGTDAPAHGPRSPDALSRTQTVLYAFLALFVTTTAANAPWLPRPAAGAATYAAAGALAGVGLVGAVTVVVLPRLRRADPGTLARRQRHHTILLTAAVVAYLLVAWVAPGAVGLPPAAPTDPTGLPLPGVPLAAPVAAAALAAAAVTLFGLFAVRRSAADGGT